MKLAKIAILLGGFFWGHLQSQNLPHPKYNLRYHFVHNQAPLKSRVLSPKSDFNKRFEKSFLPIGRDSSIFTINSLEQLGYDTIRGNKAVFPIAPFYLKRTEITNREYQEFIQDSSAEFFKKRKISGTWIQPDPKVWQQIESVSEAYVNYYTTHKAYLDYPVVGISQYQATLYCDWLEDKLNHSDWAKKEIPQGFRIQVDLPTAGEFYAAVDECILKPTLGQFKQTSSITFFQSSDPRLIYLLSVHPSVAYGSFFSDRMIDFRTQKLGLIQSAIEVSPAGFPQVSHLLGNVAEWTSTWGFGHLYNNKEYVYTTNGDIRPNLDEMFSEKYLSPYLHSEKALKMHYAVKGGSFNQDFFYLDPSAVQMHRGDEKQANIGFRTVLRIVPINPWVKP